MDNNAQRFLNEVGLEEVIKILGKNFLNVLKWKGNVPLDKDNRTNWNDLAKLAENGAWAGHIWKITGEEGDDLDIGDDTFTVGDFIMVTNRVIYTDDGTGAGTGTYTDEDGNPTTVNVIRFGGSGTGGITIVHTFVGVKGKKNYLYYLDTDYTETLPDGSEKIWTKDFYYYDKDANEFKSAHNSDHVIRALTVEVVPKDIPNAIKQKEIESVVINGKVVDINDFTDDVYTEDYPVLIWQATPDTTTGEAVYDTTTFSRIRPDKISYLNKTGGRLCVYTDGAYDLDLGNNIFFGEVGEIDPKKFYSYDNTNNKYYGFIRASLDVTLPIEEIKFIEDEELTEGNKYMKVRINTHDDSDKDTYLFEVFSKDEKDRLDLNAIYSDPVDGYFGDEDLNVNSKYLNDELVDLSRYISPLWNTEIMYFKDTDEMGAFNLDTLDYDKEYLFIIDKPKYDFSKVKFADYYPDEEYEYDSVDITYNDDIESWVYKSTGEYYGDIDTVSHFLSGLTDFNVFLHNKLTDHVRAYHIKSTGSKYVNNGVFHIDAPTSGTVRKVIASTGYWEHPELKKFNYSMPGLITYKELYKCMVCAEDTIDGTHENTREIQYVGMLKLEDIPMLEKAMLDVYSYVYTNKPSEYDGSDRLVDSDYLDKVLDNYSKLIRPFFNVEYKNFDTVAKMKEFVEDNTEKDKAYIFTVTTDADHLDDQHRPQKTQYSYVCVELDATLKKPERFLDYMGPVSGGATDFSLFDVRVQHMPEPEIDEDDPDSYVADLTKPFTIGNVWDPQIPENDYSASIDKSRYDKLIYPDTSEVLSKFINDTIQVKRVYKLDGYLYYTPSGDIQHTGSLKIVEDSKYDGDGYDYYLRYSLDPMYKLYYDMFTRYESAPGEYDPTYALLGYSVDSAKTTKKRWITFTRMTTPVIVVTDIDGFDRYYAGVFTPLKDSTNHTNFEYVNGASSYFYDYGYVQTLVELIPEMKLKSTTEDDLSKPMTITNNTESFLSFTWTDPNLNAPSVFDYTVNTLNVVDAFNKDLSANAIELDEDYWKVKSHAVYVDHLYLFDGNFRSVMGKMTHTGSMRIISEIKVDDDYKTYIRRARDPYYTLYGYTGVGFDKEKDNIVHFKKSATANDIRFRKRTDNILLGIIDDYGVEHFYAPVFRVQLDNDLPVVINVPNDGDYEVGSVSDYVELLPQKRMIGERTETDIDFSQPVEVGETLDFSTILPQINLKYEINGAVDTWEDDKKNYSPYGIKMEKTYSGLNLRYVRKADGTYEVRGDYRFNEPYENSYDFTLRRGIKKSFHDVGYDGQGSDIPSVFGVRPSPYGDYHTSEMYGSQLYQYRNANGQRVFITPVLDYEYDANGDVVEYYDNSQGRFVSVFNVSKFVEIIPQFEEPPVDPDAEIPDPNLPTIDDDVVEGDFYLNMIVRDNNGFEEDHHIFRSIARPIELEYIDMLELID